MLAGLQSGAHPWEESRGMGFSYGFNRAETLATHTPTLTDLTTAERRILKAIAQKKTTREIASELFVSPRTVESHRANISTKLCIKGANSLLQFALEHRDALEHLV